MNLNGPGKLYLERAIGIVKRVLGELKEWEVSG